MNRNLSLLISSLDPTRFEVTTVSLSERDDQTTTLPDLRPDVRQMKIVDHGPFSFSDLAALRKCIEEVRPNLLSSHGYKADIYLWLLRTFGGIRVPTIGTAHGWVLRTPKLLVYYALDKLALASFERIVLLSEAQRAELPPFIIDEERIQVIPNGVRRAERDIVARAHVRDELRYLEGECVVGYIGRLSPEKRVDALIRAIDHAQPLLLVGDGPERKKLEQFARDLGKRVTFLGFQENVGRYLSAIDVFTSFSSWEGMPNSVLEAMSFGLPCVLSDIPHHRTMLRDSQTAMLVHSEIELGRALKELSREPLLRQKLGDRAQEFVTEQYSLERRRERFEQLYLELSR